MKRNQKAAPASDPITLDGHKDLARSLREFREKLLGQMRELPKARGVRRRMLKTFVAVETLRSELDDLVCAIDPTPTALRVYYGPREDANRPR